MDPAPAPYMIRINGHLGAAVLSAFPALAPQHHGAHTVLTGLVDRSALYGVLAEIEALGMDLPAAAGRDRLLQPARQGGHPHPISRGEGALHAGVPGAEVIGLAVCQLSPRRIASNRSNSM
jgi:hypothetical protein